MIRAPGALLELRSAAVTCIAAENRTVVHAAVKPARRTIHHHYPQRELRSVRRNRNDLAGFVHVVTVHVSIGAFIKTADFRVFALDQRYLDDLLRIAPSG